MDFPIKHFRTLVNASLLLIKMLQSKVTVCAVQPAIHWATLKMSQLSGVTPYIYIGSFNDLCVELDFGGIWSLALFICKRESQITDGKMCSSFSSDNKQLESDSRLAFFSAFSFHTQCSLYLCR